MLKIINIRSEEVSLTAKLLTQPNKPNNSLTIAKTA